MEFKSRQDLEAPQDRVFAALSDFEQVERRLLKRGVDVRRSEGSDPAEEGTRWSARFKLRGKRREAEVVLERYRPPEEMVFFLTVSGLEARTRLDFIALSPGRTRVQMTSELTPRTLSARLVVQSMKLSKGKLDRKLDTRMEEYARELEARLARSA